MSAVLIITIDLAIVFTALAIVSRLERHPTSDAPRQVADDDRAVEFSEFRPVHKSVNKL